jgi:hypothetical protein
MDGVRILMPFSVMVQMMKLRERICVRERFANKRELSHTKRLFNAARIAIERAPEDKIRGKFHKKIGVGAVKQPNKTE